MFPAYSVEAQAPSSLLRLNSTRNSRQREIISHFRSGVARCGPVWLIVTPFYSHQLCLCPFPAYSVFSPAIQSTAVSPSTKWSETCTTTLILLISVSFGTNWGGGCNMHFYL